MGGPDPPNDNCTPRCLPNCSRTLPRFLPPCPHPPSPALSLGHNSRGPPARTELGCSGVDPRCTHYFRICSRLPMCGKGPHTGGGVRWVPCGTCAHAWVWVSVRVSPCWGAGGGGGCRTWFRSGVPAPHRQHLYRTGPPPGVAEIWPDWEG